VSLDILATRSYQEREKEEGGKGSGQEGGNRRRLRNQFGVGKAKNRPLRYMMGLGKRGEKGVHKDLENRIIKKARVVSLSNGRGGGKKRPTKISYKCKGPWEGLDLPRERTSL